MVFHDVIQGSDDWYELRRGIPTASNFSRIITAKTMKLSAQADDYICELVGDKYSHFMPERVENYTTRPMQFGQMAEEEARRFYSLERNVDVTNGGFATTDDGRFGCSVDAFVGDDGCLEIKAPLAKTQVRYLLDGGLPADYRAQVAGHLIVSGRAYCDFLAYAVGLPPLLVRVVPDEFTAKLRDALEQFWAKYQQAISDLERTYQMGARQ
jgi:hypothetical protein